MTFDTREREAKREQAAASQAALDRAVRGPLDEEMAEAEAAADVASARHARRASPWPSSTGRRTSG